MHSPCWCWAFLQSLTPSRWPAFSFILIYIFFVRAAALSGDAQDRQGCELGGGRAHSYVPEHVRIGIPQAAEWLRQEGRLLRSTPVLLYIPSTLSPPLSSTAAGVVWNLFRRCVRLRGLLLARRWKFRAGAEVGLCEGDPCGDRQCLCLCQSSATRVVVFSPLTLRSSLERGSERSGGCCTASAHAALPARLRTVPSTIILLHAGSTQPVQWRSYEIGCYTIRPSRDGWTRGDQRKRSPTLPNSPQDARKHGWATQKHRAPRSPRPLPGCPSLDRTQQ